MIPYLRIENLKNHTLSGGTYLYSPYMGVPPPPPTRDVQQNKKNWIEANYKAVTKTSCNLPFFTLCVFQARQITWMTELSQTKRVCLSPLPKQGLQPGTDRTELLVRREHLYLILRSSHITQLWRLNVYRVHLVSQVYVINNYYWFQYWA